ncbi:MAG: diguanylate cyclase, partial [Chloroflexi bacterium]|nr:diguanylate cyclase [Chloroflexota bacterium]
AAPVATEAAPPPARERPTVDPRPFSDPQATQTAPVESGNATPPAAPLATANGTLPTAPITLAMLIAVGMASLRMRVGEPLRRLERAARRLLYGLSDWAGSLFTLEPSAHTKAQTQATAMLAAAVERQAAERRHTEQLLRAAEARFRVIADLTSEFVYSFRTGKDGRLTREWITGAFIRITGYAPEEADFFGGWVRFVHTEDRDAMWAHIRRCLAGQPDVVEVRIMRKDGQLRWLRLSARPAWDAEGRQMGGVYGIGQDITERKQLEAAVEHQAQHDPLTGLGNRSLFERRLENELPAAIRDGQMLGVLMLDLDRFKEVNDTFGHRVGDQLLQQVAVRLKMAVRESDSACRLGGDEFAVVLPQIGGAEEAAAVARRAEAELTEPFIVEGLRLSVGVSIGVTVYPNNGSDIETLIRSADAAMYTAKRNGGGAALSSDTGDATRAAG